MSVSSCCCAMDARHLTSTTTTKTFIIVMVCTDTPFIYNHRALNTSPPVRLTIFSYAALSCSFLKTVIRLRFLAPNYSISGWMKGVLASLLFKEGLNMAKKIALIVCYGFTAVELLYWHGIEPGLGP
jgi:hypothetical protein